MGETNREAFCIVWTKGQIWQEFVSMTSSNPDGHTAFGTVCTMFVWTCLTTTQEPAHSHLNKLQKQILPSSPNYTWVPVQLLVYLRAKIPRESLLDNASKYTRNSYLQAKCSIQALTLFVKQAPGTVGPSCILESDGGGGGGGDDSRGGSRIQKGGFRTFRRGGFVQEFQERIQIVAGSWANQQAKKNCRQP